MNDLNEQLQALGIDLDVLIKQAVAKTEELLKAGFTQEAELVVKQLMRVDPENLQGMQLYGLILFRNKKNKEAVEILSKAIALDSENAENFNNIALAYLHLNNNASALEAIQKAVALKPFNHDMLNNLALVKRASGDLDGSIDTLLASLKLKDDDSRTWESLGSCFGQKKLIYAAIECFQKSLTIDPENLGAHVDLAYGYHLCGEWDLAWKHYEYRLPYWHQNGRNPGRFYELYDQTKAWDGKTSLNGKTIVVYCEQGTGDLLHFVRFVPKLTKLGAIVTIDAPNSLATILKDFGHIRTDFSTQENYDFNCSILSLPYLLNISPDGFMGDQPYLPVTETVPMTKYENDFKIGIVWAGNPGHPNDGNRSCHLSQFKSLSQIPGVKLFSLQKETSQRVYTCAPDQVIDLAVGCEDMKVVDMSEFMVDYQATANIISSMDLVITVDTSVLHVAGGIGKETWALIPYNPDWRWTLGGDESIWYSSVKLFRQEEPGNWTAVFDNITAKLKSRLHENIL